MRYTDTIEQKVEKFMEKHAMISPGDRVIAGVSGGADSVCLLFVLLHLMEKMQFSLEVVHVNHGIRTEACEDAAYVRWLCETQQIPFTLVEENVPQRAVREKRSEEEMGRLVRYEAFERVKQEVRGDKIAVAHNCNDQAETMLFHLFRGSGISGLCGIRPVRDGIIRPILCLEREEIECYLKEKRITYCQDATNAEDDYTRNRIRHHILPYAADKIVQGCVSHMAQTATILLETEEMLVRLTQQGKDQAVRKVSSTKKASTEPRFAVSCQEFGRLEPVIAKRIILELLKSLSPSDKDIGFVHVEDVAGLFKREGNRLLCLPYDIVAERRYGEVWLYRGKEECREPEDIRILPEEIPWMEDGLENGLTIPLWDGMNLCLQVFSYEKWKDIPQNRYTKWFDYDRINEPLTVRTRRQGDYLCIRGSHAEQIHKSVKDYMITEKILRQERDRIPILSQESHVLWVMGYRISEYYKISENTKHILQVQLRRDCTGSETEEKNGRTC